MTNFSQSSQSAAYAEVMHVLSPWYGAGIKSKFLHHPLFEFFRGMGQGGVKLILFFNNAACPLLPPISIAFSATKHLT